MSSGTAHEPIGRIGGFLTTISLGTGATLSGRALARGRLVPLLADPVTP